MTDREKYKQAFSVLHTSDSFSLEEKKMAKLNRKRAFRNIAAAAAACILVIGGSGTAYANNVGGIQRTLQIWMHGELTDAEVTFNGEGSYDMKYTDSAGSSEEMGGGGVAIEDDGSTRPLSPEELQEHIIETSSDVEFRDDGTVWFICKDQKTDITDKFKNGYCHVKVTGENNKPVYFTIKSDGEVSASPDKYPE